MQIPLQLSVRNLSEWERGETERTVRAHAKRLDEMMPALIGCRVAVSRPQAHQRSGSPYRVSIQVTMAPRKDLVVTRETQDNDIHDDLVTVLTDAFHTMERRVKETADKRNQDVKARDQDVGFVTKLFAVSGYGFLQADDGEQVYFHRNAVLHGDFDKLTIGAEVRFERSQGDEGPQASSVQIIDRRGTGRHADVDQDGGEGS